MESSGHYTLGFPEMDSQHFYLYDIFALLEDANRVCDRVRTGMVVREIERYVLFHFESEELLLRRYGFPGFAVHQSDHEALESRLADYMEEFESGTLNPGRMRAYLSAWLEVHSRELDSVYAAWITDRRAETAAGRSSPA